MSTPNPQPASISDRLKSDRQMADLQPIEQARRAITHVLHEIRVHPEKGFYLGLGTQSFALLTEAAAALYQKPLEEVRDFFKPQRPRDPYANWGGKP